MLAFLISCIPGLGPFAPTIANLAQAIVETEAADVLENVKKMVAAAELTSMTGPEKFDWVFKHVAADQPAVALRTIRLFIEMEVALLKI